MAVAVGVDLGGTNLRAGVVDDSGNVVGRAELPSGRLDADDVCVSVAKLVRSLGADGATGVGVGAAGIIDFERGRYLYGPNLGLREIDLGELLSKELGVPVRVDNDANCAAWAEHRFGAGVGASHFLCITLGTGIGGGIVANGLPYRGATGGAAEIGHMLVDPEGPLCGCGRRGCWEQMASGSALGRRAREELERHQGGGALFEAAGGDPARVTGPMVTDAARAGDQLARDVVDEVARWVGWGLASLVNVLEPERIAIAGGVAEDWDLFADGAVAAMVERMEAPEHRSAPAVVRAHLGADAGIVGAALLVLG